MRMLRVSPRRRAAVIGAVTGNARLTKLNAGLLQEFPQPRQSLVEGIPRCLGRGDEVGGEVVLVELQRHFQSTQMGRVELQFDFMYRLSSVPDEALCGFHLPLGGLA